MHVLRACAALAWIAFGMTNGAPRAQAPELAARAPVVAADTRGALAPDGVASGDAALADAASSSRAADARELPVPVDACDVAITRALRELRERRAEPGAADVSALRAAAGERFVERGVDVLLGARVAPLEPGQRTQSLSVLQRELLIRALCGDEHALVQQALSARRASVEPAAFARAALPVLAVLGQERHVPLAIELLEACAADPAGAAQTPPTSAASRADAAGGGVSTGAPQDVRAEFVRAISALLVRDERAFERVSRELRDAQPSTRVELVLALGETRSPNAFALLERALGRDSALLGAVLAQIPKVGLGGDADAWNALCEAVASALEKPGNLRAQAALAAGTLGDVELVEPLIALLDAESEGERANAHAALQRISGLAYPRQVALWRAWAQREERWCARDFDELLRCAETDAPTAACNALRRMADHPLYRHRLAQELQAVLDRAEPVVVIEALRTLRALGSPYIAHGIEHLLDTGSPEVAAAAAAALDALLPRPAGTPSRAAELASETSGDDGEASVPARESRSKRVRAAQRRKAIAQR